MTEPEYVTKPEHEEVWECEQCGEWYNPGKVGCSEAYCSDDCEQAAEADDAPPCHHSPSAWRQCDHCKSVVGDLQYQRMKEGEL